MRKDKGKEATEQKLQSVKVITATQSSGKWEDKRQYKDQSRKAMDSEKGRNSQSIKDV